MSRNWLLLAVVLLLLVALGVVMKRGAADAAALAPAPANPGHEQPGLQVKAIHELRERTTDGATEYLVDNLVNGPIEVRCTLQNAENARADPELPRRLVVPARGELPVTELHVLNAGQMASAEVSCLALVGDPRATPEPNHKYALPFAPGTKYTLDQGFGGKFSHNDPENRYALDFGVPEGTPVLAARAGTVMQVEESFRGSGTDPSIYGDRANFVRVLHDDGSMAVYAHLAPDSMLRRPGDRVAVGQMVGKSGNTGFSTGPHLHFCVQSNTGMALRSLPFGMAGVDPYAARE
jgi:murein DD-endopeptidase MepM/ murein hydrolase activator NlpD